jgi:hypothetical protein
MHSKNKPRRTADEDAHVERVKSCDCVLCDAAAPTDAHEIEQGLWWLSIAVCRSCHQGPKGIHGDQTMLRLRFKSGGARGELLALNETLRRVAALENA